MQVTRKRKETTRGSLMYQTKINSSSQGWKKCEQGQNVREEK